MGKVDTFERYEGLTGPWRSGGRESNLCLLPATAEGYIKEGRMRGVGIGDGGTALLVDMGGFYKLYLSVGPGRGASVPPIGATVVADVMYVEGRAFPDLIGEALTMSGFVRVPPFKLHAMGAQDAPAARAPGAPGYRLEPMADRMVMQALALVTDAFGGRAEHEPPDRAGMGRACGEGRGVCLIGPDGRVCGYCGWEYEGGRAACVIRHVVMAPGERGRGLARSLLAGAVVGAGARSYRSWVAEGNAASERLHESVGFKGGARRLVKYVRHGAGGLA
ncbi:MAG: GNAT family N-acetyltransferase [Oscillospiraceae bacterium]|nr:GNAT family N-acetyltransferase [Oscillospiraceae bacterium]